MVLWRRIIIDEAHSIKNHKSLTAQSVCRLSAVSRWALTGTPIHNNLLDMYALLRCQPAFHIHTISDINASAAEALKSVTVNTHRGLGVGEGDCPFPVMGVRG